jgi:quinol monooxygenase YgiN
MNSIPRLAAASFAFALAMPSAMGQTVTAFSRFHVTPGREAEAEARIAKLVAFVREQEPNVIYRFYRAKSKPEMYMTYEVFPSVEVAQRHLKEVIPAAQAMLGPIPEGLYAKPQEVEVGIPLAE